MMNDSLTVGIEATAAVGAVGEPGRAVAGGGRQQPEPRGVPGTDPPGRAGGAFRPAVLDACQGGPVPRAEDAGRTSTGRSTRRSRRNRSSTWPRAGSSARIATCCCSVRRAWAKSSWSQAIGYQAIKCGFAVLYRSIFDVVRDFLHDEALGGEDKVLGQLPQARPIDHRRHGDEAAAEAVGRVPVRDHHAAL